ncbi:MAG TPA: hypothetical protein VE861_06545, partial [Gemmatimonadaceae bacterium]|nr:hypothetical protein [Gemmatimonadaceae bacterium]
MALVAPVQTRHFDAVRGRRQARQLFTAASLVVLSTSPLSAQSGTTSAAPSPDPRVGLRAGLHDAAEATWNLRVLSRTQPTEKFRASTSSDLAFTGKYA